LLYVGGGLSESAKGEWDIKVSWYIGFPVYKLSDKKIKSKMS
jgi:hypothetical protein